MRTMHAMFLILLLYGLSKRKNFDFQVNRNKFVTNKFRLSSGAFIYLYWQGQSAELPLDQEQNAGLSVQKLESKNENSYVVTSYAYKRKDLVGDIQFINKNVSN